MTDAILPVAAPLTRRADPGLAVRRWVFFGLNLASMAGLAWVMIAVLSGRGWSLSSGLFLVLFLIGLPWTMIGFWNAAVGFVILRLTGDPVGFTNPAIRATAPDSPIVSRTAICLAVRHEDVMQVFARLD